MFEMSIGLCRAIGIITTWKKMFIFWTVDFINMSGKNFEKNKISIFFNNYGNSFGGRHQKDSK